MTNLCFMLLLMLASCFQESDDSLKAKADRVKEQTANAIKKSTKTLKELKDDLRRIKRAQVNPVVRQTTSSSDGITYPSKEMKREAAAEAEARLKEFEDSIAKLKNGDVFFWGLMQFPLAVGNFGHLFEGGHIVQVIDGESALIEVNNTDQQTFQFTQTLVLFKGIDTMGMTDGAGAELKGVYEVTETTQYATAIGGTKTVFVLRPVDKAKVEALLKK